MTLPIDKTRNDKAYWEQLIMQTANLFVNIRTHLKIKVPGKGLCLTEGKNSRLGEVYMINGFAEVVNTDLDQMCRVFITPTFQTNGLTYVELMPKVGFRIHSSDKSDSGFINYFIVEGLNGRK